MMKEMSVEGILSIQARRESTCHRRKTGVIPVHLRRERTAARGRVLGGEE